VIRGRAKMVEESSSVPLFYC